jgi:hypothetical protein
MIEASTNWRAILTRQPGNGEAAGPSFRTREARYSHPEPAKRGAVIPNPRSAVLSFRTREAGEESAINSFFPDSLVETTNDCVADGLNPNHGPRTTDNRQLKTENSHGERRT